MHSKFSYTTVAVDEMKSSINWQSELYYPNPTNTLQFPIVKLVPGDMYIAKIHTHKLQGNELLMFVESRLKSQFYYELKFLHGETEVIVGASVDNPYLALARARN